MTRDSTYGSLKSNGQAGHRLAKPPPEEPDALIAHVRVCEGDGPKGPSLLGNDACRRLKMNGADAETIEKGEALVRSHNREWINDLHSRLKDNPKSRWKDSIKKMLGLDRPTMPGADT